MGHYMYIVICYHMYVSSDKTQKGIVIDVQNTFYATHVVHPKAFNVISTDESVPDNVKATVN